MAEIDESGMWSRAARIESFKNPQKKQKKRASAQSKKTLTARWPHETPTAEQLARAGFYFHFSNDADVDSARCFCCGLKLDGWEADDDPVKEHIAHIKDTERCIWATCLSVSRNDQEEPEARDPLCDELMSARKETFGERWPHEGKRNWKCKVDRMAEAGWSFDPSPQDSDGVTCHYCGLELSGFEPKDDPFDEHKRRKPSCRYFELIDFYHQGKLPKRKRAKTTKPRSSAASKASRTSVRSVMSMAVSDDMDIDDGGTDILGNDEVEAVPIKSQTEEPKPKPKRATKAKSTSKTSKPRKKATSQAADTSDAEEDHVHIANQTEAAGKKPKRASKKASQTSKAPSKEPSFVEQRASDVSNQLQAELEESVLEGSPNYWVNPERDSMDSFRGTKRSSDGSAKADNLEQSDFDFPMPPSAIQHEDEPKAKRTKTSSAPAAKRDLASAIQTATIKQTSSLKPQNEEEVSQELARLENEEKANAQRKQQARPSQQRKPAAQPGQVLQNEVGPASPQHTEEPEHKQAQNFTPSPSGSDKENNPSSLESHALSQPVKKSVYTSPTKTTRIPLAQSTPNRPTPVRTMSQLSPSKRQLGTITSAMPWTAVDIDTVLLSPTQNTPGKLRDQLVDAAGVLSQNERCMTVESWIKWRAGLSEDELKQKCEEMVGIFEREGNRALECLHGLNITA